MTFFYHGVILPVVAFLAGMISMPSETVGRADFEQDTVRGLVLGHR
jgi:hypothetical protein